MRALILGQSSYCASFAATTALLLPALNVDIVWRTCLYAPAEADLGAGPIVTATMMRQSGLWEALLCRETASARAKRCEMDGFG